MLYKDLTVAPPHPWPHRSRAAQSAFHSSMGDDDPSSIEGKPGRRLFASISRVSRRSRRRKDGRGRAGWVGGAACADP